MFVRTGCKSMPGTNILAYHERSQITVIKSVITSGPGANVIKTLLYFTDVPVFSRV